MITAAAAGKLTQTEELVTEKYTKQVWYLKMSSCWNQTYQKGGIK